MVQNPRLQSDSELSSLWLLGCWCCGWRENHASSNYSLKQTSGEISWRFWVCAHRWSIVVDFFFLKGKEKVEKIWRVVGVVDRGHSRSVKDRHAIKILPLSE